MNSNTFFVSMVQSTAFYNLKPTLLKKKIEDLHISGPSKTNNQKGFNNLNLFYIMLLVCWDYLPWMASCYWNLLLKAGAFIVSFANYFPTFIAVADNTIRPILKNLQQPIHCFRHQQTMLSYIFTFFFFFFISSQLKKEKEKSIRLQLIHLGKNKIKLCWYDCFLN